MYIFVGKYKFHWLIEAGWGVYTSVNYTIIGSDNGLSPIRWQPIIWTNDGLLSTTPYGIYFNEILLDIKGFSFTKMHMKSSWLGRNVLRCPHHPQGILRSNKRMRMRNIYKRSEYLLLYSQYFRCLLYINVNSTIFVTHVHSRITKTGRS